MVLAAGEGVGGGRFGQVEREQVSLSTGDVSPHAEVKAAAEARY